jgi:hypothetical protein
MADANDEFQRAQAEAAAALQRLAAVTQATAGAFGGAGSGVKASAQSVGQGLYRLRADLDRGRVGYRDAAQALRQLEAQFDTLTDATKQSTIGRRLADEQARIGADLFRQALGQSATELAKVSVGAIFRYQLNQLATSVKAIQDNAGGMQMSFQLQNQAIQDTITNLSKFETALAGSAAALALVPNPYARAASVIAGLGSGLAGLLTKAEELKLKGFQILQIELLKSQETFKAMTGAGAVFAGGVTEIREMAALASLDLKELSTITAQNAAVFAQLGGSVSVGVNRFARVNEALKSNRQELLNLGYSYEQQAQASVDYMNRLQQSGKLMNQSPEQLAKETAQYLKHLKAVSALTGEDEKRLKQRQQAAREQAAVQIELRRTGGDAAQKFDDLIGQFPGYERAIQQLFTVGTVTDPVLATVLANNQELDAALQQGVENIRNNNINAKDAQQQTERNLRANAKAIQASADDFGSIAGVVDVVNGNLRGQADLSMQNYRLGQRAAEAQKAGAPLALDAVQALALTNDKLTAEMGRAEIAFREAATAFNRDILPQITQFATEGLGGFKSMSETIKQADAKLREAVSAFTQITVGGRNAPPTEAQQRAAEREQRIERETPGLGREGDAYRDERSELNLNLGPGTQLASDTGTRRESSPVALTLTGLSDNTSNQFKESFVQAMVSYQQQRATVNPGTATDGTNSIASVTDTLRDVFSGQNGFNQVITGLKDQILQDNGKQITVLQTQAEKMDALIAAIEDGNDYSRQIAINIA